MVVVINDKSSVLLFVFFFFFQAEDGIRDVAVTGVQTCALPISLISVLALILGTTVLGQNPQAQSDLYPFIKNDKLGFIDRNGREVIPAQFSTDRKSVV